MLLAVDVAETWSSIVDLVLGLFLVPFISCAHSSSLSLVGLHQRSRASAFTNILKAIFATRRSILNPQKDALRVIQPSQQSHDWWRMQVAVCEARLPVSVLAQYGGCCPATQR
jgi:hypothetical protein